MSHLGYVIYSCFKDYIKPKISNYDIKWFTNRIGKRVYRDDNLCTCKDCKQIEKNGLIIENKDHANYLCAVAGDYANDGIYLNYRDKK